MHTCTGCDTLPPPDRLWHGLYAAWYDHDRAGHTVRAAIYGAASDACIRLARA